MRIAVSLCPSGVITFSETLYQSSSAGETFVDVLRNKGVLVGIKVDLGLDPLPHSPRETSTKVTIHDSDALMR